MDSPVEIQALSNHTVYDLVRNAFEVYEPRDDETVDCHLWDISIGNSTFDCGRAKKILIGDLLLEQNSKIRLHYDYGNTSTHDFTVTSIEVVVEDENFNEQDFPRRKPGNPTSVIRHQHTPEIDLNSTYAIINEWCFGHNGVKELNFFQAGKTSNHGWFVSRSVETQEMIFVADKAKSLGHYMKCLEKACVVAKRRNEDYDWHSIVILPSKDPNKPQPARWNTYLTGRKPGFCDCCIQSDDQANTAIDQQFPLLAAFAGFSKNSKTLKRKGWLRYLNKVLLVCTGNSSPMAHPQSPKSTAFQGEGPHRPANPTENVLFRIDQEFASLHELFCAVEGLLATTP